MGATFGNIHILNQERIEKDQITDKLVKGLEELGYETTKDRHYDLSLKIIYKPSNKWICLYNDSLEEISIKDLKKQATLYKNIFNTDVIASYVYDSDILMMSLDGTKKDFYCVLDEPYDDMEGYNPNTSKGSIKKWSHLINQEFNEKDLKDIWDEEVVFAEDKLLEIGKVLGFDETLCTNGFNSFSFISQEDLNDYDVIELNFINKNKAYHLIPQEGLPQFKCTGCLGGIIHGPGLFHTDEDRAFAFFNKGGKSKGFDVILLGEAIDNNTFHFESIKITKNFLLKYHDDDVIAEAELREAKLVDGTKVLLASFSEIPLLQGFKVNYDDNIRKKLGISHVKLGEEIDALEENIRIIFRVKAESDKPVTAKLMVYAVPHENRPGLVAYECTITSDQGFIDDNFRRQFENDMNESYE